MGIRAKRVLVPVRGDETDEEALWLACKIARESKGKVYVLYVIEVERDLPLDTYVGSESARAEKVLQQMEKLGSRYHGNVEAEILQSRDAGPAIVQEAVERQTDVIVLAVPYKRRYGVYSLGNLATYVLQNAPCPVLLWRHETEVSGKASRVPGAKGESP